MSDPGTIAVGGVLEVSKAMSQQREGFHNPLVLGGHQWGCGHMRALSPPLWSSESTEKQQQAAPLVRVGGNNERNPNLPCQGKNYRSCLARWLGNQKFCPCSFDCFNPLLKFLSSFSSIHINKFLSAHFALVIFSWWASIQLLGNILCWLWLHVRWQDKIHAAPVKNVLMA